MKRISIILLSAAASFTAACSSDTGPGGDDDSTADGQQNQDEWTKELATRVVDYNAALRIAALRLTGDIPTMTEIAQIRDAGSPDAQKTAYETLIKNYMRRPAFAR